MLTKEKIKIKINKRTFCVCICESAFFKLNETHELSKVLILVSKYLLYNSFKNFKT